MKKLLFLLAFLVSLPVFGQKVLINNGVVLTNNGVVLTVPGFSDEYQAIYDAYTTKPDNATAFIWNTCVETWVANGEWATKDIIYVYAAHTNDNGEALINWKNPGTFDATAFNAPAFVANEGFTGNGSNTYIDCNWNPNSDGVNFVMNSASAGVYIRTNVEETKYDLGCDNGTSHIRIISRKAGDTYLCRIHDFTDLNNANTDSRGMIIVSRTASNARVLYKNKSNVDSDAQASVAVPNFNIYVLANNGEGSAELFTTRQLSMAFAGAGMTQTHVNNFTDPFEVAMDALSKGVIP